MAEEKSDTILISQFFFPKEEGATAQQKLAEMKQLTPEDKAQLGAGIRDGSLSY